MVVALALVDDVGGLSMKGLCRLLVAILALGRLRLSVGILLAWFLVLSQTRSGNSTLNLSPGSLLPTYTPK
jgi:hypothetical protein